MGCEIEEGRLWTKWLHQPWRRTWVTFERDVPSHSRQSHKTIGLVQRLLKYAILV